MKKLLIVILSLLIPTLVFAAETQTNVSGSIQVLKVGMNKVQLMNLALNRVAQQLIHLTQI